MNTFRTAAILIATTALFLGLGALIGGWEGMLAGFVFASALSGNAYWRGAEIAIRIHAAELADAVMHRQVIELTEELAERADIPTPTLYIAELDQPNAFAAGRGPGCAIVILTTGLLAELPQRELAGIIAHEIAHIRSRDTLTTTIAATIAGASAFMGCAVAGAGLVMPRRHGAGFLLFLFGVFAAAGALLLQACLSRSREYAADRAGAEICGSPKGLRDALMRIAGNPTLNPVAIRNPAHASLYVVSPFFGDDVLRAFDTHPPIERRIAALEAMMG